MCRWIGCESSVKFSSSHISTESSTGFSVIGISQCALFSSIIFGMPVLSSISPTVRMRVFTAIASAIRGTGRSADGSALESVRRAWRLETA